METDRRGRPVTPLPHLSPIEHLQTTRGSPWEPSRLIAILVGDAAWCPYSSSITRPSPPPVTVGNGGWTDRVTPNIDEYIELSTRQIALDKLLTLSTSAGVLT